MELVHWRFTKTPHAFASKNKTRPGPQKEARTGLETESLRRFIFLTGARLMDRGRTAGIALGRGEDQRRGCVEEGVLQLDTRPTLRACRWLCTQ
jgi:hypothetical protein